MTTNDIDHEAERRQLRSAVERAGLAFSELVRTTPSTAWGAPTPCPDWRVGDLVAHVIGVAEALVPMAQGNGPPPPVRPDGLFGPQHTAERLEIAIRRGLEAWSAQDLESVCELPWGRAPGRRLLELTLVELVGHGWDLGQAIGSAYRVPAAVVDAAVVVVAVPDGVAGCDRMEWSPQPDTDR